MQVSHHSDTNRLSRIVDLERNPPPSMASFGKLNLELWDVSGDFANEKCWPAI